MPIYDRSYNNHNHPDPPATRHSLPPLRAGVMRTPHRRPDVTHRRPDVTHRHPDVTHRHPDVTHRPRFAEREFFPRSRGEPALIREQTATTRDSSYGYDRDYFDSYYRAGSARVEVYTHDSSDPFSCACFPRASDKTIPSMMYDGVRCPHPEHTYQPAKQDYFAYPWTTQTYRPNVALEHGYKRGQVKPPSALTAPPFTFYTAKDHNPSKGNKPPPYSAPEKASSSPLMSAKPTDRRLRRVNRQRVTALPNLDTVDEDLPPFDSVSQGAPLLSFRPPSLRLRTVDSPVMGRVDSELRETFRMRAMSTPRAMPAFDIDGFPETPNRIFKGEYVDSTGQKYQYDIKYGLKTLDGRRKRMQTL